MSNYTAVDLDEVNFSHIIHSHFTKLHKVLLQEHKRELENRTSSLKTENEILRQRLVAFENDKSSKPLIGEEPQPEKPTAAPQDAKKVLAEVGLVEGERAKENAAPPHSEDDSGAAASAPSKEERVTNATSPTEPDSSSSKNGPPLSQGHSHGHGHGHSHHFDHGHPDDYTPIQRVVFTQGFEIGSGCVILANTVVMALRLQYDGIDIGFNIGASKHLQSAADTWPHADAVFYVIDILFNCIFILELLLRFCALKLRSWHSGWMWFDTVIVTISAVDTLASSALPVNPGMLRVMRLARLVRLFKILKTMQAFDSLFLLQKAIVASMSAAVWSFAILISVQLVVGLFLNQLMQTFLLEDGPTESEKQEVHKFFGTFTRTMLTMFQIIMANWVTPCRALVENVSEWFTLFFLVYRCFFCFAVLKVIAAVFITETNRVLAHDDELTFIKLNRERALFDKKVRSIVRGFAGNEIDLKELKQLTKDPEVKNYLSTFGFSPSDLEKLFFLVEDGKRKVEVDNFLQQINNVKGQSKSIDMLTSLQLIRKLDLDLRKIVKNQGLTGEDDGMIEELCLTIKD